MNRDRPFVAVHLSKAVIGNRSVGGQAIDRGAGCTAPSRPAHGERSISTRPRRSRKERGRKRERGSGSAGILWGGFEAGGSSPRYRTRTRPEMSCAISRDESPAPPPAAGRLPRLPAASEHHSVG